VVRDRSASLEGINREGMAINFGVENRRSAEGQEGEVTADRVSFDEGTTWRVQRGRNTEHGT
jgi:hypothetical protein